MILAFLILVAVLFRRLGPAKLMKQEIKYSQILKKYEGDKPSHLELNLRADPKLYVESILNNEVFSDIAEESDEEIIATEQAEPIEDRILLESPLPMPDPEPILEIDLQEPIRNDIS